MIWTAITRGPDPPSTSGTVLIRRIKMLLCVESVSAEEIQKSLDPSCKTALHNIPKDIWVLLASRVSSKNREGRR